ncbi:MAG: nitrite reductase [Sporocytophaga sp.]|uniref:nitrite reductase n=1 Tax=Sporocytophaga sp. TaxID=2231183 RepID=UPI001B0CF598|nr:nitrite reductase [Sporocytophaga sp.]MBO9703329.1 nitrite reductase [Sporocytophaga sp.]
MALTTTYNIDKKAFKDILELEKKIQEFQSGKIDAEKFRAFRLARGVYGQRQDGVNMVRIKLPFGKLSPEQLICIADISDQYASGNLHATTRQDIQIHYVKVTHTPEIWARLEEKGITLREACGNTIRNLTASYMAGIDPEEPFDVSPYAAAMFKYFLRNPICQELGRKFKIAFSSSEKDSAFTFIHDLGFIPKLKIEDGIEKRGFKVVLAGGLGAQPFLAHPAFDFLPEDQVVPFAEAVIRIFDRYGERARRHKARLKYLVNDLGLEKFLELVAGERMAIKSKSFKVNLSDSPLCIIPPVFSKKDITPVNKEKYEKWLRINVIEQKQKGFYGVHVKLSLGNLSSDKARSFAEIAKKYASDDIRITVNQGLFLKYIRENVLASLFNELDLIGLADPGFDTIQDITACPGTDTCNLGIASSTGLAEELERVLREEYKDLVSCAHIKIKISGCMNACAHHTIANIGFHGMSLKQGEYVLPAMQVLLGGGPRGNGEGRLADKVIKVASKKAPDVLRYLLNDYEEHASEGEYFNDYYDRQGKNYFYLLLKPLTVINDLTQDYFLDWGNNSQYQTMIGVGECAGALIDMVALVIEETKEKLLKAEEAFGEGEWVDSIYYSYSVFINAGKALLLTKDVPANTQYSVLNNFEKLFIESGELDFHGSFKSKVLEINQNEPTKEFAKEYMQYAANFFLNVVKFRSKQIIKI